jgi:catechol 2,3-dioxygenase
MSTAFAPIEIGRVALTVNDLPMLAGFYQSTLGLTRLSGDGETVTLGAGDRALLVLREDRAARRTSPREAGLFHTAFLMPSRSALARWLVHASDTGVQLQGASDHLVSEALYLSDPEGNGIEVYADRPRATWSNPDGSMKIATLALDLNELALSADGPWQGVPDDAVVGHVHLRVGDVPEAEAFYADLLGLAIMAHYPGAAFFGSGGYHHHVATNTWNSRGAGPRIFPSTGLAEMELLADGPSYEAIRTRAGDGALSDPWGTPIALTRKHV